jgi:hypothetical protein
VRPKPDEIGSWAQGLRGTYAMRARFFSLGANGARESHEVIARADVETNATFRTTLTTTLCRRVSSESRDGSSIITRTMRWPQKHAYALRFDHELKKWSSVVDPVSLGFTTTCREPAEYRSWLARAGVTCKCPSNLETLPSTVDDCRVTDVDDDGNAGLTFEVSGAVSGSDWVALRDWTGFKDGKVDADGRHTASFEVVEQLSALECAGNRACKVEPSTGCPTEANKVEFVAAPRQEGVEFNCATILAQAGTLFQQEPAPFPADCQPN